MIIADLFISDLAASSKKQAFQEIAAQAAPLFHGEPEGLLTALLERERIGSTGIGNGVAIPHIKIAKATRMYGILTHLQAPIDYDALDGQPVDIVFMLIAPTESKTTQHLKMLAYISRFLKDPTNCAEIRAAKNKDLLANVLHSWIKKQAAA